MKKIVFFILLVAYVSVSCNKGNDIENVSNKITRVQDGKGKVFTENGTLVDANLNYTREQLLKALNSYEWEREYSFYYDNSRVSDKTDIDNLPTKIHTDGTIENVFGMAYNVWTIYISGKKMIATMKRSMVSSSSYPPETFFIISLDLSNNSGRMILDEKINEEVLGFDNSSLYARMVWKAIIP